MLSSPGAILVGLIGATAMVVALHKVTILPVDTTGSLLFALAVALSSCLKHDRTPWQPAMLELYSPIQSKVLT
jgi:hypothetical protein